MNAPFAPFARPESASPVTGGASTSAPPPLTTRSPSVIAWLPRPTAALFPAESAIVPPLSASAEAEALSPSASESTETTV